MLASFPLFLRSPVARNSVWPFALGVLLAALACSSRAPVGYAPVPSPSATAAPPAPSSTEVPPRLYVQKVKNLLLGLPATEEEVRAVEADPAALGALVDGWMARPEYKEKTMRFFQLAFQQTQVGANDFAPQVYGLLGKNPHTTALLIQNATESFARTMVELTAEGRPLTEAMTTRRLMMTTALKELYAFLDVQQIDNQGNLHDEFRAKFRGRPIVVHTAAGAIAPEQTLDERGPRFMHWYNPDLLTEQKHAECRQDPVTLPATALGLHWLILGSVDGRRVSKSLYCPGFPGTAGAAQLKPADFEDWTMVTLRPPLPGEPPTRFYDLPALRAARELVLAVPRLGFFSTPAFFANWPTNVSNQMRVTVNQALIVATGAAIDPDDGTMAPGTPGLDNVHARRADCFSCHKTMDPTRSILSAHWSYGYHRQVDEKLQAQPGMFAFRGVVEPVKTAEDFGQTLARHPLVGPAWAQKLCHYLNSGPCREDDPEFQRIVQVFRDSGYSWATLVKTHATSPLTTQSNAVVVSRRNHLCAALDARLGFTDSCGLDVIGKGAVPSVPEIATGLPSDAYGRGAVAPVLPNDPTVFFAAGVQNICESVAAEVIDAPAERRRAGVRHWSSAEADTALSAFVHDLMGLTPSDPRADEAARLLRSHFKSAVEQGAATPTDALRSAFMVACQSPSVVSIGL